MTRISVLQPIRYRNRQSQDQTIILFQLEGKIHYSLLQTIGSTPKSRHILLNLFLTSGFFLTALGLSSANFWTFFWKSSYTALSLKVDYFSKLYFFLLVLNHLSSSFGFQFILGSQEPTTNQLPFPSSFFEQPSCLRRRNPFFKFI